MAVVFALRTQLFPKQLILVAFFDKSLKKWEI